MFKITPLFLNPPIKKFSKLILNILECILKIEFKDMFNMFLPAKLCLDEVVFVHNVTERQHIFSHFIFLKVSYIDWSPIALKIVTATRKTPWTLSDTIKNLVFNPTAALYEVKINFPNNTIKYLVWELDLIKFL